MLLVADEVVSHPVHWDWKPSPQKGSMRSVPLFALSEKLPCCQRRRAETQCGYVAANKKKKKASRGRREAGGELVACMHELRQASSDGKTLTIVGPLEERLFPEAILGETERVSSGWWNVELLRAWVPEVL